MHFAACTIFRRFPDGNQVIGRLAVRVLALLQPYTRPRRQELLAPPGVFYMACFGFAVYLHKGYKTVGAFQETPLCNPCIFHYLSLISRYPCYILQSSGRRRRSQLLLYLQAFFSPMPCGFHNPCKFLLSWLHNLCSPKAS